MRPSVAASGVRASSMASSAYSCARAASTSSISAGCSPQGAGCKIVHATSITAATDNTRLVGTFDQLDTKGWEMLVPACRLDNSTSGVNCFLSSVAHVVFLLLGLGQYE